MRLLAVSAISFALLGVPSNGAMELCAGLARPVEGPLQRGFAPTGRYSGHWGTDWGVPEGTNIRAAGPGKVTYAGTIAGNMTLTIDHGGGLRTSYSYLSAVMVRRGDHVTEATTLGMSGVDHGSPALHFSVRIGPTYVDPLAILGCRLTEPSRALRLVPVGETH
jgi:murein DD-endopeptidase MepM/ murein hydrolase activator NlpD